MAKGKNFFDFILEAQRDTQLTIDFLKANSPEELEKFFVAKGFNDITDEDCEKLIEAMKSAPPDFLYNIENRVPGQY